MNASIFFPTMVMLYGIYIVFRYINFETILINYTIYMTCMLSVNTNQFYAEYFGSFSDNM